jgi:hypothetical protein
LAYPFLRFLLSSSPAAAGKRSPELGYVLLAAGWCVLFFSLSGCKLPTYVLPAFPLLALALGYFVAESRWRESRLLKPAVGMAAVMLAVGHYGVIPRYAAFRSPMSNADEVVRVCGDPGTPVICYPRPCDSVGYYLGRDDLRTYRSKDTPELVRFLRRQPRTVILFTHRHSLNSLREVLPRSLCLTGEAALGGSFRGNLNPEWCYLAVVEPRAE